MFRLLIFVALFAATLLPGKPAFCQAQSAPPATKQTSAARPRQVRFDVQLTRTGTAGTAKADTPAPDSTKPDAPKPDPAPPSNDPVIIGSPSVSTLDRNTATATVTGGATSYTLALSPTIETADNAVQVLWNLRMNGKDFPGGTASFTLAGAARIVAGTDTPLAEMTLSDPKTGQAATFRVRVRVTLSDVTAATTATP